MERLKEIYKKLESDIDSDDYKTLTGKVANYYNLLVYKEKNKNLSDNEIATLMQHYQGFQSYVWYLVNNYEEAQELIQYLKSCQRSILKVLTNNNIKNYKGIL